MRSVSGEVLSSYPISLSKATKIISKFVSAETGASQAVCAYLRRASASFSELNHLHKELKSERQRHRKSKSEITEENRTRTFGDGLSREPSGGDVEGEKKKNKKKRKGDFGNFRDKKDEIGMGVEGEENLIRTVALWSQQPSHGVEDSERKKQKMIKKEEKEKGEVGNFVENQGEIEKRDGKGERGIEEKRIKVDDGVTLDSTKKKEIDHFGDNGVKEEREGGRKMGSEEKGEERKKMRKSEEVEEGGVDDDSEQRRKKKKKKKKKKKSKIDGEN